MRGVCEAHSKYRVHENSWCKYKGKSSKRVPKNKSGRALGRPRAVKGMFGCSRDFFAEDDQD